MEDELKHILIEDFEIQSGFKIKKIELTYQIFGIPIGSSPVILINHALTGNSLVCGKNGWWRDIVGDNKPIDTKKFTVICFNIPGNGFNENGFDYSLNINLGDVALLFIEALEKLKISNLFAITGGSIGGCLTWEMLAIKNDIADKIIPIAADWKANDWLIANTYLQDRILENSKDPVADARIHAMTFYRTPKSLNKLLRSSNITRDGISFERKIQNVKSKIDIISVDTDIFFLPEEDYETTSILKSNKIPVNNHIIKSIHGHDAFLIETNQISDIFTKILK